MLVFPLTSNAISIPFFGIGEFAESAVNSMLANIANFFLMVTASFVAITGALLSLSIKVTTNIHVLYGSVTAIESVWRTVRDLSSIFIIFALLYFSIKTILGLGGNSMNQLIVKIFLAGILINFSLFFIKVAVDVSNIVSLQFYGAITQSNVRLTGSPTIDSVLNDSSGLSNIFMQSLQIPKIYKNKNIFKAADVTAGIGLAAIGGIIMMIVASLSFLAASVAFIARTAILLGLMALSPLIFVGMIFPEIKSKVSDKMLGQLKNQCIFMPVYLFLLYVSLKIISDPKFTDIFNKGVTDSGSPVGPVFIAVIIQYTIAIIFINIPLFAAIQMGGVGMKWAPNANTVGKWFGAGVGQNTVGRAAKWASDRMKTDGSALKNPNLTVLASKGLGKISGAAFGGSKGGYDKRFKNFSKEREELLAKNIKLSDSDKKRQVEIGLSEWDIKSKALENKYEAAVRLADDPLIKDPKEKDRLRKEVAEFKLEMEARNKAENTGGREKYLAEEALKETKESVAKNIEKQTIIGFFTNKARKEAAEAYRKEANKSEEKKLLDKLQKLAKDADKEPDEEKPPKK